MYRHTRRLFSQSLKKSQSQGQQLRDLKYGPLSKAQRAYLDRVIRVDQSGELGANLIYNAQYVVLANKYPHLKPVLQHMWDQEVNHYNSFNHLQTSRRVRPSLLTPLWKLGAVAMGGATALLSKEAAMACTVAVETVIGNHYNKQLRVLMNQYDDIAITDNATGKPVDAQELEYTLRTSPELNELKKMISEFRDEELEHLDTAVEHDADKAVPYQLLTETIKLVCKGAIWTAERI